MSYGELYVSQGPFFSGLQASFKLADYVILGVPFDVTSTYRTGARFGPLAIRETSLNLETYSFRTSLDVEKLKLHDLGDLHVTSETDETMKRLALVVKDIVDSRKIPVLIGGEHTITLGAVKGLSTKAAVISFDAHLDLRNEYMNLKTSHTTFMRRINEQAAPQVIIEIGTRAVCQEELMYAKKAGVKFFTTQQIRKDGTAKTVSAVEKILGDCKSVYLTIDMDVFDPAFAPAVQNPEPDGLSPEVFFDLLEGVCDNRVIALDLVEVCPHYDSGATAALAVKTLFEALCNIEKARKT
ncbi:MAG TPA: agmatinase [Candidatus Bathyarchaeia archaeon]|nr:agmatinase [Candidatus Bathyarchaeia archaeon]